MASTGCAGCAVVCLLLLASRVSSTSSSGGDAHSRRVLPEQQQPQQRPRRLLAGSGARESDMPWSWDAIEEETKSMPEHEFKKSESYQPGELGSDLAFEFEIAEFKASANAGAEKKKAEQAVPAFNPADLKQAVQETEGAVAKAKAVASSSEQEGLGLAGRPPPRCGAPPLSCCCLPARLPACRAWSGGAARQPPDPGGAKATHPPTPPSACPLLPHSRIRSSPGASSGAGPGPGGAGADDGGLPRSGAVQPQRGSAQGLPHHHAAGGPGAGQGVARVGVIVLLRGRAVLSLRWHREGSTCAVGIGLLGTACECARPRQPTVLKLCPSLGWLMPASCRPERVTLLAQPMTYPGCEPETCGMKNPAANGSQSSMPLPWMAFWPSVQHPIAMINIRPQTALQDKHLIGCILSFIATQLCLPPVIAGQQQLPAVMHHFHQSSEHKRVSFWNMRTSFRGQTSPEAEACDGVGRGAARRQ
jgi:hypothetical protein